MRTLLGRLSLIGGLVLVATSLTGVQAGAAPPTVVTDGVRSVYCTASVGDDTTLMFGASISDLRGVSSSYGDFETDGRTNAEGTAESTWGDGSFSAVIPIYSRPVVEDPGGGHRDGDIPPEEEPVLLGELSFSGTYAPSGDPVTDTQKFRDRNRHVDQSNTVTPLSVDIESLTFGDTVFADVSCSGESLTGELKYTNPQKFVEHYTDLSYECTAVNASEYPYIEHVDEGWYVQVGSPDWQHEVTGIMAFGKEGTWAGELNVSDGIGSEPTLPASATLKREGQRYHAARTDVGFREDAQVTPYRLRITAELPTDEEGVTTQAQVDCLILEASITSRTVNVPEPEPEPELARQG